MTIQEYIDSVSRRFASGITTEHSFRGDLERLIESLADVTATNEPKRIECGAPDYVITRKGIPVGYVEAKDVGVDLEGKNLKEQFDRYRDALDNLAFTDYLDFRFYVNGLPTASVRIAEIRDGRIVALPDKFDEFTSLIREFCSRTPQTIKGSKKLAEMMAEKAKILAFIIKNALEEDIASGASTDLTNQLKAFKDILIHDIDAKAFADIYAQTIAYGMFAARLHDPTLPTFSRQEAAELIPKTNPFLRKLFQFIATYDLDTRIDWIVDALADLFRATDIAAILKNFGRSTQTHDPIMHFYETFLAEYDPKLRKSRGVFYTPEPVVDFIVRAVDDILKSKFNLPQGLADTSKTKITVKTTVKDERTKSGYREEEKEVHRVQILDPATGTGTFLATVIKHIHKGFENQQGVWNQYVDEHLIPRLNGFELLMASYAMAHLKLDLLLTELSAEKSLKGTEIIAGGKAEGRNPRNLFNKETDPEGVAHDGAEVAPHQGAEALGDRSPGFHPGLLASSPSGTRDQRFQIYLTNALEEYHPDTGTLFASWLSTEANEANHIKRDTPVMVVIGNPPYSGESANKGEWIMSLMDDYKKEPGGVEKLKERNPKWINDDYVKFLRYGQHFIEKNGEGILAFINPHGFLDNPTFRGMRWNLLKTFNSIYILDLHGNSNKKEVAEDGSVDKNVFDIKQGVCVAIFVKTGGMKANELGKVFHHGIFGKRELKNDFLTRSSLNSIPFKELSNSDPNYFFVVKNFSSKDLYYEGFRLPELMPLNGVGITTAHDEFVMGDDRQKLIEKFVAFKSSEPDEDQLHVKFRVKKKQGWNILHGWKNLQSINDLASYAQPISFRPFDSRFIFLEDRLVWRTVRKVMDELIHVDNLGLVVARQCVDDWRYVFITKLIGEFNLTASAGRLGSGNYFPLYLYPDNNAQQTLDGGTERVPNLNSEIVERLAAAIGLTFVSEKDHLAERKSFAFPKGSPNDPSGYAAAEQRRSLEESKEGDGEAELRRSATRQAAEDVATDGTFAPIDILDYIYAVLHSPSYRERYKEFLKIDFPRVPYPTDAATFWQLVALGGELRQIHLLESPVVSKFITGFPVGGDNTVEKIAFVGARASLPAGEEPAAGKDARAPMGRVYFNETQYFDGVPEVAWNFYIGGYQPAQKWLKDRKGRTLSYEDIRHYQKVIVALTETARVMGEIDAAWSPGGDTEAAWASEAEDRLDAYEKGEIEASLAEDVIDRAKKSLT